MAGQANPDGDTDVNRVHLSCVHLATAESMLSPFSHRTWILCGVPLLFRSSLRLCDAPGRLDKAAYAHGSDILPDVERLQPDAIRADREDGSGDACDLLFGDLGYAIVGRRHNGLVRLLCRLAALSPRAGPEQYGQ